MAKTSTELLLIGAHTSAAGGVSNALRQGAEIGATTIQFFTSNQKQWAGRPISLEERARWKALKLETGISTTMSHASYLLNLGSPKEEGLLKSRAAFREELIRCHDLDVTFLNFHPGAALEESAEKCLDTIVASIESVATLVNEGNTTLLLETTAGQGSIVGHTFEQLGYLTQRLRSKVAIGVCIDTCHIFAAGYDMRKGWDEVLTQFDASIGLQFLKAFHLNDSVHPLGSRKDRHAHLGEGHIGIHAFQSLMAEPRLREIPKYLETPEPTRWAHEIQLLRSFAL